MSQSDPVTISTVWHYLQRVCLEMRDTIFRTTTNFLIAQLHDISVGIFGAQGQIIAVPEGFAGRMLSASLVVKETKSLFGDQIYPGDVFLTNEPFRAKASHLPDWFVIRPVFKNDELIFFAVISAHMSDNGGAHPGSYFLAEDSIAEGLHIPPIKVMERGNTRTDVLDLILSNTRLYLQNHIDTLALIACTAICEKRIMELIEKYSLEVVLDCINQMIDRTEKAVRAEIKKWPDGTYSGESATDDDGFTLDVPVWVRSKVTIKGDTLTIDLSESDKQVRGYLNCTYSATWSTAISTVFGFLDPALATYHNEGSIKPITVIAPEGLVVNPKPGALVAAGVSMCSLLVIESIMQALSKAIPEKATAGWCRDFSSNISGVDPRSGQFYVYVSFNSQGGCGAVYGYDGYQCANKLSTFGSAAKANVEEEEIRYPWRTVWYEWATDSCGAGKWRGAPGFHWESVNESGDTAVNLGPSDGAVIPVAGALDGKSPPVNSVYFIRNGERVDLKIHRIYPSSLGDILGKDQGGGAGVGAPEDRDPEAVKDDIRNELVSIEAARDVYKVIVDPDTLEIDYKSTKALRSNSK